VLVVGVLALGVLAILRDRIVNPTNDQISVSAEGKVFAKPDIAQVDFGVQTDTKSEAADVVQEGTEKMNAIIAALQELGIEEKDIKTTSFNLNPVYYYPMDGERQLSGYELYQQVTLKIRNLDIIGDAIQTATTNGANQIGNVVFTIDETDALQAEARIEAIAKARTKAEEIAQQAGIKLGKIVSIYESGIMIIRPRTSYSYDMGGGFSDEKAVFAAPEVETGEMEVTTTVTLTYRIK
jgi:uncharacterized protein YggE